MAGDEAGAAGATMAGTAEANVGPSRESRATFTFATAGTFEVFTLVVYGSLAVTESPIVSMVYLIGPLIRAAVLLLAAFGLFRRRAWAEAVVTPMLVVLIVGGVATLLLTLAFGGFALPIAAIVAVWALLAPRRAEPAIRPPGGLALLGALVLSALLPFVVFLLPPG
jgi:hypothetical protein